MEAFEILTGAEADKAVAKFRKPKQPEAPWTPGQKKILKRPMNFSSTGTDAFDALMGALYLIGAL